MHNNNNDRHSYLTVRGKSLGFVKDGLPRKHSPRMCSLITARTDEGEDPKGGVERGGSEDFRPRYILQSQEKASKVHVYIYIYIYVYNVYIYMYIYIYI